MFGFPFLTSLVVTVALVVAFSFVINKGVQKKRDNSLDEIDSGELDLRNHRAS